MGCGAGRGRLGREPADRGLLDVMEAAPGAGGRSGLGLSSSVSASFVRSMTEFRQALRMLDGLLLFMLGQVQCGSAPQFDLSSKTGRGGFV